MEGLAVAGAGSLGTTSLDVPAAGWSLRRAEESIPDGFDLAVEAGAPGRSGHRSLVLRVRSERIPLEFGVGAPEVRGGPSTPVRAGDHAWILHWPVEDAAWEPLRADRPELVVLGNARALFSDSEKWVGAIRDVRERLGSRPLLWAPRVALPHRLAMLVYCGVDIVDTTQGLSVALDGVRSDRTLGRLSLDEGDRPTDCGCAFCAGTPGATIDAHVAEAFRRELALVRAALRHGRLRELVEIRLASEPGLAEILRYVDTSLASLLDERTAVIGSEIHGYVLSESLRRPEIVRYVRRFVERYRPPPSKEVLLLLPCSRTKPYRNSPSHRRYLRALEGLAPLERLHVASITSPLGIVPRELEDVHPCRQYDIPVTGAWDEEERRRVVEGIRHLTTMGRYRRVILHVDPVEYAFLRAEFPPSDTTVWSSSDDRTLSPDALRSMRTAVEESLRGSTRPPGGPLAVVREELREVAAMQFGRSVAERLLPPTARLYGRPWFQKVQDAERTDLATLREERGLFQLTVNGARAFESGGALSIELQPDVHLSGDLFTPGVLRADPGIRVGDAVVLWTGGAVAGVGEAVLPGRLMTEIDRGLAVHVRHRAHAGSPPISPSDRRE